MTMQSRSSTFGKRTVGDTAVDGLLAGIGAGLVMALFLLVAGLVGRETPANVLGRFDLMQANSALSGLLTHLAVSAIYGLIFGLLLGAVLRLRPSLLRFGWLAGVLFGLALWLLARGAFFAGVDSGLAQFTAVNLLLAHGLYGLLLGVILSRKW